MLRFYDYIFYSFYRSALPNWKSPRLAAWSAFAQMGCLMFLHVLALLMVFEALTGKRILENGVNLFNPLLVAILVLFGAFMMRFWGREPRYSRVISDFEKLNETKKEKLVRGIYIWLYISVWLTLFVVASLIVRHQNAVLLGQPDWPQ